MKKKKMENEAQEDAKPIINVRYRMVVYDT